MATDSWKTGVSGDFNLGSNWSTGVVPTSADDALITAAGTYTVSSSQNNTVNSLAMQAHATLDVTTATFAIASGSGAGGLAGVIAVENAAVLDLGGAIVNSGVINEKSTGNTTEIVLTSANVALSGGGSLTLSNNPGNFIFGAGASDVLDNIDNVISGAGNIGNGQMTLANETAGVINANQSTALTLNTAGNSISNAGILEATLGGTLIVDSTVVNSSTGRIIADGAGSVVQLLGGFSGGTLTQINGGTIETSGGSGSLNGLNGHPVTVSGVLAVPDGTHLSLLGTINNTGTIALQSTGSATDLIIASPVVKLQGGGAVILSNSPTNFIFANNTSYQLINVNDTISGAGQLGNGQLTLINDKLINANQLNALVINTSNYVTNAGTLESTNTTAGNGGLNLSGNTIDDASTAAVGVIQAIGKNTHVDLNGASLIGGTLKTSAGGVIQTANGTSTFDGQTDSAPVNNQGVVVINNATALQLVGAINNTGTIQIAAGVNATDLRIASQTVTLTGGGIVALTNTGNSRIFGTSSTNTLLNVNNRIIGAGQLGVGQLTFVNQAGGVVNANQTTALTLSSGAPLVINQGTFVDTWTGGFVINNTAVNNAGGTIEALGANRHVDLAGGYIEGGTLLTTNGGVIQTVSGSGNLDGITAGAINIAGTVLVNDATALTLEGVLNNTGTVSLAAGVDSTDLRINSQTVTLQGGGQLVMSNSGANRIFDNTAHNLLLNVDNKISGAGQLGIGAQMYFTNEAAGVVNANQATALVLNTSNDVAVNQGLFEGTGSGGLVIVTAVNNAGGTIQAVGASASVQLAGGNIEGGILTTSGGGVIETVGGNGNLDGITAGAVNNKGSFVVTDNTVLFVEGVINNTGTVNLASVGNSTDLRINSQTVTLQGGGQVVMSNTGTNRIFDNAAQETLVNVDNTISGAGQFGAGTQTYLVNQTGGVVNANQATALVLSTSNDVAVNQGLFEGTGSGGLVIVSAVNNAGGTIQAAGASATVQLAGGYIEGGILTTSGGGVIETVAGNGNLDGITAGAINNKGSFVVTDATIVTVEGVLNNTGTVSLAAGVDSTDIRINSQTFTLQGGGQLVMSNSANNRIFANAAQETLLNVDNTLSGAGQIGAGTQTYLVNQAGGVVNANQATALVLNTSNDVAVNQGLFEGTGSGGLVIQTAVDNAGGTIQAAGASATVQLAGGYIEGGLLTTSGGGVIETVGGNGNLDGITDGAVTIAGTVAVTDNTVLTLEGVINNTGTINLRSVGDATDLRIAGQSVTLQGGGRVVLSNNGANRIYSNAGSNLLDNIDNIISGAGQFGIGQMNFRNEAKGVVNANLPGSTGHPATPLILNTGGTYRTTNLGTLEASAGGQLSIQSVVDNAGGTILATGASSLVALASGYIEGGTLTTASGGVIDASNGSLDGITDGAVTNLGTVNVADNTSLVLYGAINNKGTIGLNSTGNNTNLIIAYKTVTLTGGGTILLGAKGPNRILATSAAFTLVNQNNTIKGAGLLGTGQMQLINGGTINANQTTAALTIDVAGRTGVNNGLMESTAAGGLVLQDGIYTNNNVVAALNKSAVTFTSTATITNNTEGELLGGTWESESISASQGSTLSLSSGVVNTIAATVIVSGVGSVFQTGDGNTFTPLESSLTSVVAGGKFEIASGRSFTAAHALSNSGWIQLIGGTLVDSSVSVASNGRVFGSGRLQAAVQNSGTVEAAGGTLVVTGNTSGTGILKIDANANLDLKGGTSATEAANFAGSTATLTLDNVLNFKSGINGFDLNGATADVIDVTTFGSGTTVAFQQSGTVQKPSVLATLTNGANHASVTLFGNYVTSGFSSSSSAVGTLITYTPSAGVAQIAVGH